MNYKDWSDILFNRVNECIDPDGEEFVDSYELEDFLSDCLSDELYNNGANTNAGAFKCVIVPQTCDFVIKCMLTEPTEPALYQKAVDFGVGQYFAPSYAGGSIDTGISTIYYYFQQKVSKSLPYNKESPTQILQGCTLDQHEFFNWLRESNELLTSTGSNGWINNEWLAAIMARMPIDESYGLMEFLMTEGINDIHGNNVGMGEEHFIIYDYDGCGYVNSDYRNPPSCCEGPCDGCCSMCSEY